MYLRLSCVSFLAWFAVFAHLPSKLAARVQYLVTTGMVYWVL